MRNGTKRGSVEANDFTEDLHRWLQAHPRVEVPEEVGAFTIHCGEGDSTAIVWHCWAKENGEYIIVDEAEGWIKRKDVVQIIGKNPFEEANG